MSQWIYKVCNIIMNLYQNTSLSSQILVTSSFEILQQKQKAVYHFYVMQLLLAKFEVTRFCIQQRWMQQVSVLLCYSVLVPRSRRQSRAGCRRQTHGPSWRWRQSGTRSRSHSPGSQSSGCCTTYLQHTRVTDIHTK